MRRMAFVSLVLPLCLLSITRASAQEFDIPLRINMGGAEVIDSNGELWLGDEGVDADPLNIRPNDLGGAQAILNWANPYPASLEALGFGRTAEDLSIFRSIRWDVGGDGEDWYMELPIPNGPYEVNIYLCEAGGDGRHYSISLEDEIVEEDVHSLAFPTGEGIVPGQNVAGVYSFEVEVIDGSLSLGMLPPPAGTPGAADINPILNGLEILSLDPNFDPCENPDFGHCPGRLRCEIPGQDLGPNHALGGFAAQSSQGWGGVPERAIDGNTDGMWAAGTTTHTNGAPSWWEVDLLDTFDIGTIRLWNRLDCCSERLTNFTVSVFDENRDLTWEESFLTDNSRINGPYFTIDEVEAEGQYVRISMPEAHLSLAEVQIYSGVIEEDIAAVAEISWRAPRCVAPDGYQVYRNDELILELPGDATGFEHEPDRRITTYRVEADNGLGGEAACAAMTCTTFNNSMPFDAPFRINMGGPQITDSEGNVWLGDMGGDPLNIRPNFTGGSNEILAWSNPTFESIEALGFEVADADIFRSIRWDNAGDGDANDWYMEIPVANGIYEVYFYLCDASDGRHYKISLEDEIVEEDVHQLAFPTGEGIAPGPNQVGVYSYLAEVEDESLSIGMLPCRDCPGVADFNPILQGLAVLPTDPDADPCDNPVFNARCARDIVCEEAGGEAAISWTASECFEAVGYEVYRNDELILELAGNETRFEDIMETRINHYRIETLVPEGVAACPPLTCSLGASIPFDIPLRINMAGPEIEDNNGNIWLGDELGPGDALNIRPRDADGTNTIPNWCAANPDSIAALGFDPFGPMVSALSSIRWDVNSLAGPFDIELAVPDGEYWLNLYFFECCCDNRHFQIFVEGELLAEDVHRAAYADALGDVGRYSFEGIEVTDGSLSISFVGIAGGDVNAILSAIEVLPGDFDPCDDENNPGFGRCAGNVECLVDGPNKALGKPATQSSQGWGGTPDRAVDGNTNGQWGGGSVTHTDNPGSPSWWEVDLLDTYDIGSIVLWNRLDCCSERLVDFTITIYDADRNMTFEEVGLDAQSLPSFTLEDIAASGQFVRVSMPGAYLSLAEVQVYEEEPGPSSIAVSWDPPACVEALGYNVYRNDELLLELPADETSFEDLPESRATVYAIETVLGAGQQPCEPLICTLTDISLPFDVPLRINAGGRTVTDDEGRTWLGDPGLNADELGIRADSLGGAQVVSNWCAADWLGMEDLGFDTEDPAIAEVLQSIRWDVGGDGIDWVMEFPVPDGTYTVNLYFIECCCANRHFKAEIQGDLVIDDIHQDFITGVSGNSIEGVEVVDGILQIALLPCLEPECPGGVNGDALVSAIEILPENVVLPPDEICDNGIDDDRDGRADCADTDCAAAANCQPAPDEICDNGIDDDEDGAADCDDTDCSEAANCQEPAGPTFVRGDANSDGSINLTDGVIPLLYLFSGGTAPACLDATDTNDTGSIEITDAIIIFSWLFSGGAAPAEPSPLSPGYSSEECAGDPTDDGIGCDRSSPVCN